jgi:hypothetical protein
MLAQQERTTLASIPIPDDFAARMRSSGADDFGHRIEQISSEGGDPCRSCLRLSRAGEVLLLASYRPLPDTSPYAEVGPIFLHRDPCPPFAGDFPEAFANRRLVVRAYDRRGWIADALVAEPGGAMEAARAFLQSYEIAEVHVRHMSYTCFDFKIVRRA